LREAVVTVEEVRRRKWSERVGEKRRGGGDGRTDIGQKEERRGRMGDCWVFPYGQDFVYDEMQIAGPGEEGEPRPSASWLRTTIWRHPAEVPKPGEVSFEGRS